MGTRRNVLNVSLTVLLVFLLIGIGISSKQSPVAAQSGVPVDGVILDRADGAVQTAPEIPGVQDGIIMDGSSNIPAALPTSFPAVIGSGVMSLGPDDFHPWNRSTVLDRNNTMMIRSLSPAGRTAMDAPLDLPQGALIKQVVASILDNDATYDVELLLVRHSLDNPIGAVWGQSVLSSGQSTSLQPLVLKNFTTSFIVDNTKENYIVRIILQAGTEQYLNNVRVEYSYSVALPSVMK